MRTIDDNTCVRKAIAGDNAAFETLVLRYRTQIYNLCYRMTGNEADAADLTQESFIKAWSALSGFHFEAAFSTWLYRLASNTCLDFLRSAKRRPKASLTVEDEDGESAVLDIPDGQPTPEQALITAEEQSELKQAMDALEPEQRQILTLRVVNDLSYSDISAILGIREGTVKSRLSRTRDALRKNLEMIGNRKKLSASKQQGGDGAHGLY